MAGPQVRSPEVNSRSSSRAADERAVGSSTAVLVSPVAMTAKSPRRGEGSVAERDERERVSACASLRNDCARRANDSPREIGGGAATALHFPTLRERKKDSVRETGPRDRVLELLLGGALLDVLSSARLISPALPKSIEGRHDRTRWSFDITCRY